MGAVGANLEKILQLAGITESLGMILVLGQALPRLNACQGAVTTPVVRLPRRMDKYDGSPAPRPHNDDFLPRG